MDSRHKITDDQILSEIRINASANLNLDQEYCNSCWDLRKFYILLYIDEHGRLRYYLSEVFQISFTGASCMEKP